MTLSYGVECGPKNQVKDDEVSEKAYFNQISCYGPTNLSLEP
jgi:hypothetical protein